LLTLPYSPSLTQFDVALLIFSIFLSFFFASLAASFLYQLQNVRRRRVTYRLRETS
jgi:hypothetical protein